MYSAALAIQLLGAFAIGTLTGQLRREAPCPACTVHCGAHTCSGPAQALPAAEEAAEIVPTRWLLIAALVVTLVSAWRLLSASDLPVRGIASASSSAAIADAAVDERPATPAARRR